ncbi:MAG: crotonase/enoyl-CoA hydratase family protein [Steroidobacteraceae bacterium]
MNKYLRAPQHLLFDVKERVARITLNRPEKRNTLSPSLLTELRDALMEADSRVDVNVVILEGAGKDFCAGYDLVGSYAGFKDGDPIPWDESQYRTVNASIDDDCWNMEQTQKLTMVLFDMHKPVIAKVHGNCLAGGTDLALMCDFIICAENAKIGFPATRANGTPPNQMWMYQVGPQWAKRMMMTGDNLWGRDAVRIGLVLDAVPVEELDAAVNELARRISFVDADMLSAHKRIINGALELQGARTLQRFATEMDARAHLCQGPRRMQFKSDMKEHGLKVALKNRDEPFGDGMVHAHWLSK